MYVVFPSFPFNPIASSVVFHDFSAFSMPCGSHSYAYNMAAFTDRNKDHYFETELSTVQTNVSQRSVYRASLVVSTEIVELINTKFEIPQNI